MENVIFHRIGLFSKPKGKEIKETLFNLINFISSNIKSSFCFTPDAAALLETNKNIQIFPEQELGKHCDLIIVIGGDGSMLKAARTAVNYNVPITGINRGTLGFLADIKPEQLEDSLTAIFSGKYLTEKRSMLHVEILRDSDVIFSGLAMNDVVLSNADSERLIEFTIFIDDQFVMKQRADGIITATPTGSTAYALSAGGPILAPDLSAFTLVPLCPHTLSNRPLVVKDSSKIRYSLATTTNHNYKLACDGQIHVTLKASDQIQIKKYHLSSTIIHPHNHQHFSILRSKLGWNHHQRSQQ